LHPKQRSGRSFVLTISLSAVKIYSWRTSLFDTLLMLRLMAAGIGLVAASLMASPVSRELLS
jgi:hypothetical protein